MVYDLIIATFQTWKGKKKACKEDVRNLDFKSYVHDTHFQNKVER